MSVLANKRILVTGGCGFLGRYTCRRLREQGATLIAPRHADYDLTEQAQVRRLFEEAQPQICVHLAAACGGIGANVKNPGRFIYANALMGLHIVEACREAHTKLVLVSTTCAYPQDAPIPLQEESLWSGLPTAATGPYGLAKRFLHEVCRNYSAQYGLQVAVLILANLYGPEDHFEPEESHVVPALIRRFVEAKSAGAQEVVNWGTGKPTREFLHVDDAARAVVLACERDTGPEPINIGTGQETSIAELTRIVADATGFAGEVRWDTSKPDGQPRRYLDTTRAKERLGFVAEVPLPRGVSDTVAWYRHNIANAAEES